MESYDKWQREEAERERREKRTMIVKAVIVLVLLAGSIGWLANGAWYNYTTGIQFNNDVGDYFLHADQASNSTIKSNYFDDFVARLVQYDLTTGNTAIYFNTPRSNLAFIYNDTLSLQSSLHSLRDLCKAQGEASFNCSTAKNQISLQEFCWFPIDIIQSGYMLKHGAWGAANWTPSEQSNRCSSNSSSGG